ncbi:MAG: hypothetical protein LWX70_09590 [Sphingobacteriia bacterium]|nr:hypothetical protein [Sphingobacteriia bacterium]
MHILFTLLLLVTLVNPVCSIDHTDIRKREIDKQSLYSEMISSPMSFTGMTMVSSPTNSFPNASDQGILKTIAVSSIDELLKYNGTGIVMVKDSLHGGIFQFRSPDGKLSVDSGMVYFWMQALHRTDGGYWVRKVSPSKKIAVSFWCKNDGSSDETFALRQALTYAAETGKTLLFNRGIYHVSGNITQANSIHSSGLNIEFEDSVKIVVTGTGKFTYPDKRILFMYATDNLSHQFSMTGGKVVIDGANLINCAISIGQGVKINPKLKIYCRPLIITNCYAGEYDTYNSYGLSTYGYYDRMIIRNVRIHNVSRHPKVNHLASQGMLIAHQGGKTLIEDCTIESIGSNFLSKDCDALVLRGENPIIGEDVKGEFAIRNCTFRNARGRHIKCQSSHVQIQKCDFYQSDLSFFPNGASIDFQFGNGVVKECSFYYFLVNGKSAFEGFARPIAFQNRQTNKKMISVCSNNMVYSKSPFTSFITLTASGNLKSASSDLYCENNKILPMDSDVTNILTRNLVEMNLDNLEAMPISSVWTLYIRHNTLMTKSQLVSYTGSTGANLDKKLRLIISGNRNLTKGAEIFSKQSGKEIEPLRNIRMENNQGWSNSGIK